ncbi:PEP/pyruvate-binding domain-containing protein [Streptomyces sp. NPDC047081]|uniref:PEP/pyruvate-binding domain-containing protein n=1 Tax=Streptomyces sp. NPDC047081 TaxID=3154706 RepID=UPI0033C74FB1
MTTLDERRGDGRIAARGPAGAYGPAAVPLDEPTAVLPRSAGSKAANLARAARAGLPVLPGFVIPDGAGDDTIALRRAWDELSEGGARPLVVRSSSPQEDTQESSLAGQFASVLDVRGWRDFRTAVRAVLDSARRPDAGTAPMAVLVQPMLAARVGGVMFGADPVEGRADRMLVSAVRGGPDSLVSGEQAGTNYWLSRSGRLLRTEPRAAEAVLTRGELFRLARLARRARRVFGGPQDIEFGFDGDGRLWLFQSRPITAMAARPARGARLLGPGPVAETLPEQLLPLEEDLWVAPMARGLAAALDIGGTAPRRLLRRVPVVTTVGGRAAADLRLLGAAPPRHRWLALLNPAPGARRLGAAWRVGRLTAALPGLATDLVADVDHHLAGVPAPADLTTTDLTAELRWTRRVLVSLHAQEALAGALLREPPRSRTAAGAALSALAEARARGVPDERVAAEEPLVLALTAPSLRGRGRLPEGVVAGAGGDGGRGETAAAAAGGGEAWHEAPVAGDGGVRQEAPAAGNSGVRQQKSAAGNSGARQETPAPGNSEAQQETPAAGSAVARREVSAATGGGGSGQGAPTRRPGSGVVGNGVGRNSAHDAMGSIPGQDSAHDAMSRAVGQYSASDAMAMVPGQNSVSGAVAPVTPVTTATSVTPMTPAAVRHTPHRSPALPPREALRLRVRWVQELQVRLVREGGRRLGLGPERVGMLRWRELGAVLEDGVSLPGDLGGRVPPGTSAPLPDAFRLADGKVVAERHGEADGGRGVSGGRVVGTVWDGRGPRPPDPVLVVRTLDPALAPLLPELTGLIAQTGSPLSHLAVLAREFGLPAVVGATDAVRRFPPGSRVAMDGDTGGVHAEEPR